MTVRVFHHIDKLSLFFSQLLEERIREIPKGRHFSLALSGGNTPRLVFEYLAKHCGESIDWRRVLVFWGDERCVPPGSEESNFRMAKQSLLDYVAVSPNNIFRIRGEEDPYAEADRYAEKVRQHISLHGQIPSFDLLMLGLGDDGHTASIFPGNLDLFNTPKLYDVTRHPETGQHRITATGTLINKAASVVFLVTGEAKADIVSMILSREEVRNSMPASYVQPENDELIWLLDNTAASKIT